MSAMELGASISYAYNWVISKNQLYVPLKWTDLAMEIMMRDAVENDPHCRKLIGVFLKVSEQQQQPG